MSDSIYKWANRTLDEITFIDKPLDIKHLSALALVAQRRVDAFVQRVRPIDGSVFALEEEEEDET